MTRITRFSARDPGPAARLAGFAAHLRAHGFRLGVAEVETALRALAVIGSAEVDVVRMALRAVCAGSIEDAARFDLLFDSFWCNGGRVRQKIVPAPLKPAPEHTRSTRTQQGAAAGSSGAPDAPDGPDGDAEAGGEGRLVASTVTNLMKKDLRELVTPGDIREAEAVARRLGAAIRDRRSRRRRAARKGQIVDLRRTLRASLATGGEPIRLAYRSGPTGRSGSWLCAMCRVR